MEKNAKRFMSKKIAAIIAATLVVSTSLPLASVSAAERTLVEATFENGNDGWSSMGNCNVMSVDWLKRNGNKSLFVGSRQANWNGALYNLEGKVQAGHAYNVSSYWLSGQINNNDSVVITLSYTDNFGNRQFVNVAQNTAPAYNWTNLEGKFTIPSDARDTILYFQTSQGNSDFFLDDVNITEVSNDSQQPQNPNQGQGQTPWENPAGSSSNSYMDNIKITPLCPENYKNKRPGVAYGSFKHETYYSSTTRSNRGFNIMLPTNYNPAKKYPVLYVLHGIFGNEYSLQGDNISEIVGNHVADGDAKEMIVVLPNMYADDKGVAPAFTDEGVAGYDNFVNDLANDLIPYIEKNYSVSSKREDRALAGFSMGGRETLFIGVTRSDLFGYVGAMAPAPGVTPGRDGNMTHRGQLQENELRIKDGNPKPYILMVCCGTSDGVVGRFPESYHNILTSNNQDHIWYTAPGAGHDNSIITSGLNNFVPAIFHAK